MFIWSVIGYHFMDTRHSFMLLWMMNSFMVICQTLKSVIREPRPLFLETDLGVDDCRHLEFGNPSAHTYGISCCFSFLVFLLIKNWQMKKDVDWSSYVSVQLLGQALSFILTLSIMLSRVFKGVHSYNQVVSGMVQGYFLSALYIGVLY